MPVNPNHTTHLLNAAAAAIEKKTPREDVSILAVTENAG